MFARTFSFWRRLIGNTQPHTEGGGGTVVEEDRRLWVRYEANLEARVQLSQETPAERIVARVRDISIGGANVIADRPFQAGQILTLELPSAGDEQLVVLACVVRVTPMADGAWSLGCVFARELSAQDLEKVGAEKAKPSADDQRTWVRYDSASTATYQRIGEQNGQTHTAQVLNVSASGVGLILREPTEPGCLISLSLQGKQGAPVRSILACIVHTTVRADGELAVGCNFIRELAEDELNALL